MTTREAFEAFIRAPGVTNKKGLTRLQVDYFRYRINHDLALDITTMERILINAGYEVIQEKQWKSP
jgi:hypothetical protein